jgi:hypothetical protein
MALLPRSGQSLGASLSVDIAEITTAASPPKPGCGRWLVIGAAILAAAYLIAVGSTHAALSGGSVGWSEPVPGPDAGLRPITSAQQEWAGIQSSGYSQVLWATRPGGEVSFGFDLHNAGIVPVTVLGLELRGFDPASSTI